MSADRTLTMENSELFRVRVACAWGCVKATVTEAAEESGLIGGGSGGASGLLLSVVLMLDRVDRARTRRDKAIAAFTAAAVSLS